MNGIPDGYEFVRVGRAIAGEVIIATSGRPLVLLRDSVSQNCVVIRKTKPLCEFPHGVFKDGWITHDHKKGTLWWSRRPEWSEDTNEFVGNFFVVEIGKAKDSFLTPVWFHPLLPKEKCIQQVGPKAEACE